VKALGELQAEALEQGGLGALGAHHAADAQLTVRLLGQGQHHVGTLDTAQLLQDSAWTVAQTGAGLPLLQGLPHDVGQEADQDVGLNAALLLMPDRTNGKLAFVNPEGGLGLGELDVGAPQGGRIPVRQIGAQHVTALGQCGARPPTAR